ncbi:MAG TPA: WhiB family transcriptional regulator [Mycobacterium sp.]|nr:WhiB family transcriptional regulator [Mycobacterium sp.]
MQDWEWRLHARCRGLPTDLFFASEHEKGARRLACEEHAKRVCRSCVVRRQCLDYAMDFGESYGVWGAMTARERQRMADGPSWRAD